MYSFSIVAGWYPSRPVCFALTRSKPSASSCNSSTKTSITLTGLPSVTKSSSTSRSYVTWCLPWPLMRWVIFSPAIINRILLILLNKVGCRMGLSRMVDHIKPLLRPKRDQQFSHSLCQQRTSSTAVSRYRLRGKYWGAVRRMNISSWGCPLFTDKGIANAMC